MKILILDDNETVMYEQDDPGHLHLPYIFDGKFDVDCEKDDCADPRCVERRTEAEQLLDAWIRDGRELEFRYHFGSPRRLGDPSKFEALPNHDKPTRVTLESYDRNELVFRSGVRVAFLCPALNVYSRSQVMFHTADSEASLYPWRETTSEVLQQENLKGRPCVSMPPRPSAGGVPPQQLEPPNADGKRCQGITKSGAACTAWATKGGLCYFHANPARASELGRMGRYYR